ncbi:GNAT family N-acetyltransferase [Alphaproteobacteria bacterium]|nr:GNAT family N-acetyltransferase [Alphaproteobacteria bacterium]
MKIVSIDDIKPDLWNQACDLSDDAWMFHRREWVDIEEKFFVRENHSFVICRGDDVVGIFPMYLSDGATGAANEILLHSGIHHHTGLALIKPLDQNEVKSARSLAMRYVLKIADRLNVDRIQLNAHNLAPARHASGANTIPFWAREWKFHLGLGFGYGGMIPGPGLSTCCVDQIIDLLYDEEQLFSRIDESARRAIRKGQKSGLSWTAASAVKAVDSYYDVALKSATRTGEILPEKSYYDEVAGNLSEFTKIIVVRTQEGEPTAAMLLAIYKGGATFLSGVSDPAHLDKRTNDFMHWSAIQYSKSCGANMYRLGPIFPQVPADWPIAKVSKFKGKFGAKSYEIIQGSLFKNIDKYIPNLFQMAELFAPKNDIYKEPETEALPKPDEFTVKPARFLIKFFKNLTK